MHLRCSSQFEELNKSHGINNEKNLGSSKRGYDRIESQCFSLWILFHLSVLKCLSPLEIQEPFTCGCDRLLDAQLDAQ